MQKESKNSLDDNAFYKLVTFVKIVCHLKVATYNLPVKDKMLLILKSQTINRKIIEEKQLI